MFGTVEVELRVPKGKRIWGGFSSQLTIVGLGLRSRQGGQPRDALCKAHGKSKDGAPIPTPSPAMEKSAL